MTDNVLTDNEIIKMDSIMNEIEPASLLIELNNLIKINPNSYYLNLIYFIRNEEIYNHELINGSQNTYWLTLNSLLNNDLTDEEYEQNLLLSIKMDDNKLNRWAWLMLYQHYQTIGNEKCDSLFSELTTNYPDFFEPHYIKCKLLLENDNTVNDGKKYFIQLLNKFNHLKSDLYLTLLAKYLYITNEKKEALELLNTILKLDPTNILAAYSKVDILFDLNELDSLTSFLDLFVLENKKHHNLIWYSSILFYNNGIFDFKKYAELAIENCLNYDTKFEYLNDYITMLALVNDVQYAKIVFEKNRMFLNFDAVIEKFEIIFLILLENDYHQAQLIFNNTIKIYPNEKEYLIQSLKEFEIQF